MNFIKNLGIIQHLQSTSEIELFNLLKNKKIDASTLPTISIYSNETFIQIKGKVTSKTWYNILFYENDTLWLTAVGYIDYTTNPLEAYIILVGINFESCNSNPITDTSCVVVSRDDQIGNPIDSIIPSNIIQEAVSSLPTSSSINTETIVLIIGAGVILYYLTKK